MSRVRGGSAALRLLARGAQALLPQKIGEVWRKPEVSARAAARVRKDVLAKGECALVIFKLSWFGLLVCFNYDCFPGSGIIESSARRPLSLTHGSRGTSMIGRSPSGAFLKPSRLAFLRKSIMSTFVLPDREAKIAAGLKTQEDLVAAYRKARLPRTGPEAARDNILLSPAERRQKHRSLPATSSGA